MLKAEWKRVVPSVFMVGFAVVGFWYIAAVGFAQGSYGGTHRGLDLMDVDIMFIGAHPDDESGMFATFARYIRDEGFKGAVVVLTAGEGGGNATGPELGPALGRIRLEELRRAVSLAGIDSPDFLGYYDFYYSLFAEEADRKWGDGYICDVVRMVRLRRPEVIVSMWPGPGTHGHHQQATRAATIAFDRANDPEFCPEHISEEYLQPFQPLKLYYRSGSVPSVVQVSVSTDDFSRSAYMRYADLKAIALSNYRTQGWDQFRTVPASSADPEVFGLVKSLVPVGEPERHLLEGALLPAGSSPPGVRLTVDLPEYKLRAGSSVTAHVRLVNATFEVMEDVRLAIEVPAGWQVEGESQGPSRLAPGEAAHASFTLTVADGLDALGQGRLWAGYDALFEGRPVRGRNYTWYEVTGPVEVRFQPLFDIANYRVFARETKTEWLIPSLPARLPVTIGQRNTFTVEVMNHGDEPFEARLSFETPPGVSVEGPNTVHVPARSTSEVTFTLTPEAGALPEGRGSAAATITIRAEGAGYDAADTATAYLLPTLVVPKVGQPPVVDGDLSDLRGLAFAEGKVGYVDRWSGRTEGDHDSSADFYVGYDSDFLYVGVRVYDQTVVCNIAPDDIRGHWRSDSVELTIDPTGASADTGTTFKVGIFPCTTESFAARAARDADALQGVIEVTAPGMQVASSRTEDGYIIEAAIPWTAMPHQPGPGDVIGFNVLVYDGDVADAHPGANIEKSRIGWASVIGAQQATPYVWPKVTLGE